MRRRGTGAERRASRNTAWRYGRPSRPVTDTRAVRRGPRAGMLRLIVAIDLVERALEVSEERRVRVLRGGGAKQLRIGRERVELTARHTLRRGNRLGHGGEFLERLATGAVCAIPRLAGRTPRSEGSRRWSRRSPSRRARQPRARRVRGASLAGPGRVDARAESVRRRPPAALRSARVRTLVRPGPVAPGAQPWSPARHQQGDGASGSMTHAESLRSPLPSDRLYEAERVERVTGEPGEVSFCSRTIGRFGFSFERKCPNRRASGYVSPAAIAFCQPLSAADHSLCGGACQPVRFAGDSDYPRPCESAELDLVRSDEWPSSTRRRADIIDERQRLTQDCRRIRDKGLDRRSP